MSYMMPNIVIVDNIPRLIDGETDRQKLLELYESTKINGIFLYMRNFEKLRYSWVKSFKN